MPFIAIKTNVRITPEVEKNDEIKENIKNLKRIKNDIRNVEHRINYILQLIEYDLDHHNYDAAKAKIQLNKELMFKIEPALQTGNELFDFMINLNVKEMFMIGKRIKICSFISVNTAYDQYNLWNPIIEMMHIILDCVDFMELYLSENDNSIFEVKILVKCDCETKQNLLINFQMFSDLNIFEVDNMLIVKYRINLYGNN